MIGSRHSTKFLVFWITYDYGYSILMHFFKEILWKDVKYFWHKVSVKHFLWICGCGWKERSNLNSWWQKTPRYKIVVHHELLRALKVQCLLFVSKFGCVLFICKFMVFEVCNSMEMSFWVGLGDGASLLLQLGWLLNEECRSHSWKLVGVGDWMGASESW